MELRLANMMTEEELYTFRNSFDPDDMGGLDIEGINEEINENVKKLKTTNVSTEDIIQFLTLINYTNANRQKGDIKYIVIHYVGATGGAYSNCNWFYNTYRGASAHYFVGFSGEIYQSVRDEDVAWQCGGGLQGSGGHSFFKICTNSNSIGIEMCVRNYSDKSSTSADWYFEDATIESTVKLVKYLMDKYEIDIDHVIRHFDVTGKYCPNPYVRDEQSWIDFKSKLISKKEYIQTQCKLGDDAMDYMEKYLYSIPLFEKLYDAIQNKTYKSWYTNLKITEENAIVILSKIGLAQLTIKYLKDYTWGSALITKLASACVGK